VFGAQSLTTSLQVNLTPNASKAKLWKFYRWFIDPHQRRDAALLLVAKSKESLLRRQRLLEGQGWGEHPSAGVELKLQG